jgi:fatty acid desaturase
MIFAVLVLALAGSASGMILLNDSWQQLLLAGALGMIFTQFAFLGHEASHRRSSSPARQTTVAGGCSRRWWASATAGG